MEYGLPAENYRAITETGEMLDEEDIRHPSPARFSSGRVGIKSKILIPLLASKPKSLDLWLTSGS